MPDPSTPLAAFYLSLTSTCGVTICTMLSDIKALTWLITGSSNGLGLALTRYVLSTGDNVIATSRNPAKTPELVKEVKSHPNGEWIPFDNTWSQDKIQQVVDSAETLFPGGIDVLVNNGAYSLLGAVEDVPEEQAKAQFETNFWGPIRICNTILPLMRQRGRGTIVNVSSLLGLTTWPAMGFYSATKFALESMPSRVQGYSPKKLRKFNINN